MNEPIPLVAHRCLVWAGRADGNTYEISRSLSEVDMDVSERSVILTWTPVEARRLSAYLVSQGWHDVRIERIAMADLNDGKRPIAALTAEDERPSIRFAAPGGLTCQAIATLRTETT